MKKMLEESVKKLDQDAIYGDANQWREIGEAYRKLESF